MTNPEGKRNANDALERAVQAAIASEPRLLLAVSGGRDSMVLLELLAALRPECIAAAATFDHGTGAHATEAVRLVVARCRELGVKVVRGRAGRSLHGEAELRHARWEFLRAVSRRLEARVATAHTLDDQVETIVIRTLRDAGARGLAGLYADTGVVRPLLDSRRTAVAGWAEAHGVRWAEDPTNQSRAFLRNRVRLDLLPAMCAARPELPEELLSVATRASALRRQVDAFVAERIPHRKVQGALIVAREPLLKYDAQGLALLWPALAARVGVRLDRRGTVRLASFTMEGAPGGRIQLSGGAGVVRHRDELRLYLPLRVQGESVAMLANGLRFGVWRFHEGGAEAPEQWTAVLPADRQLVVRSWRPGDRMTPAGAPGPRRLKGLFRDAGVDALQRQGWPVVLADQEIVWVPGVRRSSAATARSGTPVVRFVCNRLHD